VHTHKFEADENTFAKEIRKRELLLKFKQKKALLFRQILAQHSIALSDLYTKCTISKKIKLLDLDIEVIVSIHKSARKEMIEINNPKTEIARIPRAWRNADGSRIVEVI
jgi:hypothetical protein